ncbi:ubiquitin-protein ligase peroxin 12 [Chytridiales sp. JEL 0842]|nr:ubiquitin-protein ligase peroxin 12 [Chytridiales sp. JEL 0842]
MEFLGDGRGQDPFRPSLFELVAKDKMKDMLRPASHYALSIYAQRYPRYLLRLVNNHEHVYAILMLLIEYQYLQEWGKEVNSVIITNFPYDVGLPWLKNNLDQWHESIQGGAIGGLLARNRQNEPDDQVSVVNRIRKASKETFVKAYPYVKAMIQLSYLVYQVAYVFGKTEYYSPDMALLRLRIRRMTAKDYRDHESNEKKLWDSLQEARSSSNSRVQTLLRHVEEHGTCPVTLMKTSTIELRKLYSTS